MGRYCITAANHSNSSNHCASTFNLWEHNEAKREWSPLGGKSIDYINDLLRKGHTVLSGKEHPDKISTGAPIEVELRIAKNETNYKISDMPTF